MPKNDAKKILLDLIDEAFDHTAWHGPTLRGSLRGVKAEMAHWRPGRRRHSIRDLVVHAAYWKYAVRRRLTRDARGSFPLKGSNGFTSSHSSRRTWKDDLKLLADEHRKLRAAVSALPDRLLHAAVDQYRRTAAYTIRGIAAHDLYHAGQIQLIKRLHQARKVHSSR